MDQAVLNQPGTAAVPVHFERDVAQAGGASAVVVQPTTKAGNIIPGANPRRRDRKKVNPVAWAAFVATIKDKGVLEPILVRFVPETGQFQLIAGYGRWEGAIEAHGLDYDMPIRVLDADDVEATALALIENIHREDMTPIEEAEAAADMLAELKGDRAEVAKLLKWSPATLENRLALMNCSKAVRDALVEGQILLGHAELLAAVPKTTQDDVLGKLLQMPKLITVSDLRTELQGVSLPLATACFDKGECGSCPHNSELQAQMFTESISAGNCTNAPCFRAKTDAFITIKVAEIQDKFPRVQVVKPGDNRTIIKLKVEGDGGVGPDQAEACRTCANFGAVVSGVPGKEGQVFENQCFDTACNARMVAKRIAELHPEVTNQGAAAGTGGKAASTAGKKKPAAAAKPSSVTASVQEFRAKLWRKALAAEAGASQLMSMRLLMAMALTNNASKIESDKVNTAFNEITSGEQKFSFDVMGPALAAIKTVDGPTLSKCLIRVSLAGIDRLSDKAVCAALMAFEVDLNRHFTIDRTYLELLTKSEIEAVCKEVKLDKALGDQWTKLMTKKKGEIVTACLGVDGFNYAVAPRNIQPNS